MSAFLTTLHDVVLAASQGPSGDVGAVGGGLPDLGSGTAPPGAEKIVTILRWGLWAVSIACVGGVLWGSGRMALQYRSHGGGGGEAMTGLVWVLVACVIAGSATGIVGALL